MNLNTTAKVNAVTFLCNRINQQTNLKVSVMDVVDITIFEEISPLKPKPEYFASVYLVGSRGVKVPITHDDALFLRSVIGPETNLGPLNPTSHEKAYPIPEARLEMQHKFEVITAVLPQNQRTNEHLPIDEYVVLASRCVCHQGWMCSKNIGPLEYMFNTPVGTLLSMFEQGLKVQVMTYVFGCVRHRIDVEQSSVTNWHGELDGKWIVSPNGPPGCDDEFFLDPPSHNSYLTPERNFVAQLRRKMELAVSESQLGDMIRSKLFIDSIHILADMCEAPRHGYGVINHMKSHLFDTSLEIEKLDRVLGMAFCQQTYNRCFACFNAADTALFVN